MDGDIAKRLGEALLAKNGTLTVNEMKALVLGARKESDDQARDKAIQQQITRLNLQTRGLTGAALTEQVTQFVAWWEKFNEAHTAQP